MGNPGWTASRGSRSSFWQETPCQKKGAKNDPGSFLRGRLELPVSYRIPGSYAPNVYCVPAVLRLNSAGISLAKVEIASNPVQWVGMM